MLNKQLKANQTLLVSVKRELNKKSDQLEKLRQDKPANPIKSDPYLSKDQIAEAMEAESNPNDECSLPEVKVQQDESASLDNDIIPGSQPESQTVSPILVVGDTLHSSDESCTSPDLSVVTDLTQAEENTSQEASTNSFVPAAIQQDQPDYVMEAAVIPTHEVDEPTKSTSSNPETESTSSNTETESTSSNTEVKSTDSPNSSSNLEFELSSFQDGNASSASMYIEEEAVTSPEASGTDFETSEDDPNMETDAVDDNETLKMAWMLNPKTNFNNIKIPS